MKKTFYKGLKMPRVSKEANREYQRRWYANNKETQMERTQTRLRDIRAWFAALKGTLSCITCGESRAATLDFHHRKGEDKEQSLAHGVSFGWSKKHILAEIAKCDVLCANCHRIIHNTKDQ